MYDPNNIVVGVTILFLIGYAFFIIRKMYTKKINELEKINEQQRIIITNQQNVELKRASDISNNIEVTKESSTYESTFEDAISNVLPTSTVDVIIEDNGYDMSNYPEDLDKSDVRKVVEKIIANTEQYTTDEVTVDNVEEVNEVDEIDEIDELDETNKDSESELESYSEKEINNLKVMELKEILDKHGKSYSSDLKKKDLKEIVLSLASCSDS